MNELDVHVPECIKQKVYAELVEQLGGRLAGNASLNVLSQIIGSQITTQVAVKGSLLTKIGRKAGRGFAVATAILEYQAFGLVEEAADSNIVFERKYPRLHGVLYEFNRTSYLYFIAEKAMGAAGYYLEKTEDELINEFLCK